MLFYQSTTKSIKEIVEYIIPDNGDVLWGHFTNESKEELEHILEIINVHPLGRKLMLSSTVVPKVDIFKNHAYISSFGILEGFEMMKVNILVGRNYVLTFANGGHNVFHEIRKEFKKHPEHLSHTGHILFHILEKVSEFYLEMVDRISDDIQRIEDQVFKTPFENEIGHKIHHMKDHLHEMRQIVEAQENVIKTIGHSEFPYINEDSGFYMQDLLDNFRRVTAAMDFFKENVTSIFDLQMSLKSDHMNIIIKTLTLVSVIFIPMTFLAGLYGMNFINMPELSWKYGYFFILVIMAAIGIGISVYFKKKGWWGK